MRDFHHTIRFLLAHIDAALAQQLRAIQTAPAFQDLLSLWSGAHYLARLSDKRRVKIKLLDASWQEVLKLSADQYGLDSTLSRKIIDEQEAFGNEPLSLLVLTYKLDATNRATLEVLDQLAQAAAYSFLPVVTGIQASLFDAKDFANLDYFSMQEIYRSASFRGLLALAKQPYSCFLNLVIPTLYYPSVARSSAYVTAFAGDIGAVEGTVECSGAFGLAAVVVQSFLHSGWFLDMLGSPITLAGDVANFGKVPNLQDVSIFKNGKLGTIGRLANATFAISEKKEKELAELGVISLCQSKAASDVVLYTANSLRRLSRQVGENADKSSSLQYLLCVCRFAHYIRILCRAKIGTFTDVNELQRYLERWLEGYVASNPDVENELKRRYPLMKARVVVTEHRFIQGRMDCAIYLKPHLVTAEVSTEILLQTAVSTRAS